MDIDDDMIMATLSEQAKLREHGRLHVFQGYRERPDGAMAEVTVEILDRGPEAGPVRWAVSARDDQGREAHGNPDSDLEAALTFVHWYDLDR